MSASEQPVHTSRRKAASLWQQYRIFPDRLELQSWILFHTIVIPTNEIVSIEIRPSVFGGPKGMTWGVKLDLSDLHRHVLLTRKTGLFKRLAFTPDDADEFVQICRAALTRG